jgi:4-azaleucine resistance transporter AzlC
MMMDEDASVAHEVFRKAAAPGASPRHHFMLGARRCLPLAVSVAAYGVVWGVLARQAGLGLGDVALMSALVFAGSAQFVALDMWTASAAALPVGAIVVATLIVNLRFVLMTATLRRLFAGMRWRRALPMLFFVTDENWALTMGEAEDGYRTVPFLVGSGCVLYVVWLCSTVTGRLLGAAFADPARWGLDFAFTATFLALLIGMWRGRADLLPWLVAAATATAASVWLPGKWYILVGGLVGSFVGAFLVRNDRGGDDAAA